MIIGIPVEVFEGNGVKGVLLAGGYGTDGATQFVHFRGFLLLLEFHEFVLLERFCCCIDVEGLGFVFA